MKLLVIFMAIIVFAYLLGVSKKIGEYENILGGFGKEEDDNSPEPKRSLELGFGNVITAPADHYVTGVDKMLPKRKNIKFLAGEPPKLLQLRESDMEEFVKKEAAEGQKYDRISLRYSWHYVKNPGEMLNSLKKLLKNDGVIEISEPTGDKWASPMLNKGSPEFSQLALDRKMEIVDKAKKALMELAPVLFNIEELGYGKYTLTHKA